MKATVFKRLFLPGFAFKAVVIGGGYATGRELAEFFLPNGPWGGVFGMLLATVLWSLICAVTFLFARATSSRDYGTFFQHLLGPGRLLFDLAYFCMVLLMLSVFGAAAGSIGQALFGWANTWGILALAAGIAGVAAFGHDSVERLFKYVTIFLYLVYAVFLFLALTRFSGAIQASFSRYPLMPNWAASGLTYTGYNIIGAVVVLPVLRHLTSQRDALIAGLLCGPFGMMPAIVFFLAMAAFYPAIGTVTLPSDYMLMRLNLPVFHWLFQLMIFAALLESGTGAVHAVNERIAGLLSARNQTLTRVGRLLLSSALLVTAMYIAARFGLIVLISHGYRTLSFVFLTIYVAPLLTCGTWKLIRSRLSSDPTTALSL
jgi:uncharacterized membrane protein YkvI